MTVAGAVKKVLGLAQRGNGKPVQKNRFDAMRETLELLSSQGYSPKVIIDAGSNLGGWASMSRSIFPDATIHLIEPHPSCAAELRTMALRDGKMRFHSFAVTEPGVQSVRILGGDARGAGAARASLEESGNDAVQCPATTLDNILAKSITRADRGLLRLDLEGHELHALQGAECLLSATEIVIAKLRISGNRRPSADLIQLLCFAGFELFDIASLLQHAEDGKLLADFVLVRNDSELKLCHAGTKGWDSVLTYGPGRVTPYSTCRPQE